MTRTRLLPRLTAVAAGLLLAGCFLGYPPNDLIPPRPDPASFPSLPEGPALQVLVLGDWGTGKEGQQLLAQAMAETHRDSPPDFVVTVGDNFYPDGVSGPGDPIWDTHFESIYRGLFWDSLSFRPTLGNHDYYGQPEGQIQYSRISPRWDLPDRYYSFREPVPGGASTLFLALDTNPIKDRDGGYETQLTWADSVLGGSTDDWVIAMGHHPVASGGWHGAESPVRSALLPLLGERADLFAAGHNHSTELLETEARVYQAVCGGGAGLDNARRVGRTSGTLAAFTNGGWCFLRIWPEVMAVELFDRGGGLQFRHLIRKQRPEPEG